VEKALRLSVIDLGFGDSGKGQFVSAFAAKFRAASVARFNGGAQAGHNVVLPDGRHHTFSQFGAASFLPSVASVLASPFVLHPTALLIEAKLLEDKGVHAPLERLHVAARCLVITPFIQAAGIARERRLQHGSCGVGVGEAKRLELLHPEICLRYADLHNAAHTREIAEAQRTHYARQFPSDPVFRNGGLSDAWLKLCAPLIGRVRAASEDELAAIANQGACIFEGAQGLLLDEHFGFHPHTTWSSVGPSAAQAVADAWGLGALQHFGVLRSYLTRHGAGPLPTQTQALDGLDEPHNSHTGPQGRFRRGMPDAVLLRYALRCAPQIDALLLSHADAPAKLQGGLAWCETYSDGFEPQPQADLAQQALVTEKLFKARPIYSKHVIRNAEDSITAVEERSKKRVAATSHGPTADQVQTRLIR
jgi:adenylosuccinate synthase